MMAENTGSMTAKEILALADYIILPDAKAFKKLAKEHNLSVEQAWALARTVTNAIEKVTRHAENRSDVPDPDLVTERAETILDLLNRLRNQITIGRGTLQHIQPPKNLGTLGSMLSFQALKELNPDIKFELDVSDFVAEQTRIKSPKGVIDVERYFAQPKQMFDLKNRADILIFIIDQMRAQFESYLTERRPNKGGAPSNWVRDSILFDLACDASRILGKRPTSTAKGPFDRLCSDVFSAIGLEAFDQPSAVARVLKKYRDEVDFWNSDK
jgi:hypothetical protein